MNVSVVIATYHPDLLKLKETIWSILLQKEINYEIIITDDGSSNFPDSDIKIFLNDNKYRNYKILHHESNQGTIRNIIDGIQHSSSDYIYLTSPGDLLYNDKSLAKMTSYAFENKADICFGNAASYSANNGEIKFHPEWNQPKWPQVYCYNRRKNIATTSFFFGNQILGAACIINRTRMLPYFIEAKKCAKYMEDFSGYALAILNGARVIYFDDKFIWYENGVGVSTSNDSRWKKVLKDEALQTVEYLKNKYPENPIIDSVMYVRSHNKINGILYRCLRHPVIMMEIITLHFLKKNYVLPLDNEKAALVNILNLK